jgi:hypothetical protein
MYYKVKLRSLFATTVAVDKQQYHIFCVCVFAQNRDLR